LNGRTILRGTGGDDAEGWRPICLLAGSVLAALGFSLRLDALPRDSDGNDRGRCGGLRPVYRRPHSVGVRIELPDRTDPFWRLRGLAFDRAVPRAGDERTSHF